MLRIEFWVTGGGMLTDMLDAVDGATQVVFDNALPVGDREWLACTTVVCDECKDIESCLSGVVELGILRAQQSGDRYRVMARVTDETSVLTLATEMDVVPHQLAAQDGGVRGVATVQDWNHLKEFAERIEQTYETFELVGTNQTETIGFPLGNDRLKYGLRGKLSEEQIEVLQVAWEMGHFDVPQRATRKEIAQALEISPSTLSERLRRAMAALFEVIFDRGHHESRDEQ